MARGETSRFLGDDVRSLLDNFFTLGEDELDVARVGHVGVDTTVGTVGSSAALGGLVDLNVLDDEVAGVEALGVGVGLSVLQKTEELLGGLDGPASLGDTEFLALGSATSASGISAHRNGLLVVDDVLEVDESALELPSVDGLGSFPSVLEADTQIGAPGAGALCVGDRLCGVTDHLERLPKKRWSRVSNGEGM